MLSESRAPGTIAIVQLAGGDASPYAVESSQPTKAATVAVRANTTWPSRLSPTQSRRDVREDRFDHVRVVFDAERIGNSEQ